MPKLSIYVPDELWETVKEKADEDTSASHLVQRALRRLVGATDDLPEHLTEAVHDLNPGLEEAREIMREQARKVFVDGYAIGIGLTTLMPWDLLDLMSEYDFDFTALEHDQAADLISRPEGIEDWQGWVDYLLTRQDSFQAAYGIPQHRGGTQQLGIRRALRDVWEGVRLDTNSPGGSKEQA